MIRKNIEKLLKSGITAYRLSKDTGIALNSVNRLITGKTYIGNITLDNAEKLNEYYLKKVASYDMKKIVKLAKLKAFEHVIGTEKRELVEVTDKTTFFVSDFLEEALNEYLSFNEVEFDRGEELVNLEAGYYLLNAGDFNYCVEIFDIKKTIKNDDTDLPSVELEAQNMADKYFDVFNFELIATDRLENCKVKKYVALDSKEKIVGTYSIAIYYDRFEIELDRKEN